MTELPDNLLSDIPSLAIDYIEVYDNEGDFAALNNARRWLEARDYNYGPLCRDEPIGFSKNTSYIAKWKNISEEDRYRVDGVLIAKNFREGPVYIVVFRT